ncbi:MAG: RagB/SusD family nutrient uptake outer membrane protein [Ferruginibacter sp.]
MRPINKYVFTAVITIILLTGLNGCKKDFLEPKPYNRYSPEQLQSKKGIEGVLTGAYGMLDGQGIAGASGWMVGATNWVYGDVVSDDAYKGTDAGDQPQMTEIELWGSQPANTYFYYKWLSIYEGSARANDVIRLAGVIADLTPAEKTDYLAQARFLRGHFHFEAKKNFNKVPYISDTTTKYSNATSIWPQIEADFKFAYDNLTETQPQVGKANKWAAASYLAKVYMYQGKFAEAKALYDVIIPQGKTSDGKMYALQPEYWKNFNANYENSSESVFSQQNSASGIVVAAAETSYELAYPYGGDFGCCGFYQPSHNLVNAFKLDDNGLPLLDGSYNNTDLKNDQGLVSSDPFTNDNVIALDTRLDWTVGRRGIPYYDWGPHPGRSWIRDQVYAGPFSPKKHVYAKADVGGLTNGGSNHRQTAKNYNIIRFADVLLMAAEAEVEVGSLAKARDYVNLVRARAGNTVSMVKDANGNPAANYKTQPYAVPFTGQTMAREAVRFERRLELALEGHRFFDLVRWGIADQVLNAYVGKEKLKRTYQNTAVFKAGKNEYYPISQRVIEIAAKGGNILTQNPGY